MSEYEWWNTITNVEDRKNYEKFYDKFYKVLAVLENRIQNQINAERKILTDRLKSEYNPYRSQRYFVPSLFTEGTKVAYDHTGGYNSSQVFYIITKATKTYLEGYNPDDTENGLRKIRKFATKPRQIIFIDSP
jgi:hypothetical protein